nr:cdc42 effector protein 2-like isoform X1 [Pogona vitticeps]
MRYAAPFSYSDAPPRPASKAGTQDAAPQRQLSGQRSSVPAHGDFLVALKGATRNWGRGGLVCTPAHTLAAPPTSFAAQLAPRRPLPGFSPIAVIARLPAGPEMPAKTPIYLKTSTPKRGRKLRLRDVLSSDMISPPLGDFRHSAHIGLDGEGDMFGELSFLQGRYDVLPRLSGRGGPSGSVEASFGHGPPGAGYRTLLKSAVSLPVFGGGQGHEQAPPKPPRLHLEERPRSGGQPPPLPQQRSMSISCAEGCFPSGAGGLSFSATARYDPLPSSISFSSAALPEGSFVGGDDSSFCDDSQCTSDLSRSESLLRLDLDLGPSILDDVLRIMEEYQRPTPKAL